MRWLHSLLHWRCDREVARQDAIIVALMPRYQPVVTPNEPLAATISRQMAKEAVEAEESEGEKGPKVTVHRWGTMFVEEDRQRG